MSTSIPYTVPLPGGIPDTHRPHTERTTTILIPKDDSAFLNPVQEYNRDLSVSVIRAWNEERKEKLEARWRAKLARGKGRKPRKGDAVEGEDAPAKEVPATAEEEATNAEQPAAGPSTEVGTSASH